MFQHLLIQITVSPHSLQAFFFFISFSKMASQIKYSSELEKGLHLQAVWKITFPIVRFCLTDYSLMSSDGVTLL